MDVRLPDGTVIQGVPDGMSKADLTAKLKANGYDTSALEPKTDQSTLDTIKQHAGNLLAGTVRGAGSIGATILAPVDIAKDALEGKGLSLASNRERRQSMDDALQTMGAQPESWMYKGGKLGSEVAGTLGVGGVIANGARAVPALAKLGPAIESGGMSLGEASTGSKLANALLRSAGGAINGGASAGLVDPEYAINGAGIGSIVPGAILATGKAGNYLGDALEGSSKRLMQSALKPTIKQLRTGEAETAVNTLLSEGINATKGGVEKLRERIGGINENIGELIANSPAEIKKQAVIDALRGTRDKFTSQVSPASDLSAIDAVEQGFSAHPKISGDSIPVQLAQQLKQGTYKVLEGKYGQLGSAETEAQKALARGLKEQIAKAVPEVAGLNARESALISTLNVTERRALMDANKNPMGLAALAHNPASWAAFMADKSALFKSLAARMVNNIGQAAEQSQQAIPNMMQKTGLIGAPAVMATSSP